MGGVPNGRKGTTYTLGRSVPVPRGLLDTIPVVLVALIVGGVILGLGHLLTRCHTIRYQFSFYSTVAKIGGGEQDDV